jgi:hypothetical protein
LAVSSYNHLHAGGQFNDETQQLRIEVRAALLASKSRPKKCRTVTGHNLFVPVGKLPFAKPASP